MNHELQYYSPPFRTKKNVVVALYRCGFRKYVRKTVTVEKKHRIVFQELLEPIKKYYARNKKQKLCKIQQNLLIQQQQRTDNLMYQFTFPYINSKTLKQYLLNEQLILTPSISLIQSLINSYVIHISLNYTICSLSNIFVSNDWNNTTIFTHNSTSIAFILDLYAQSAINRCDFIEYINYLPSLHIQTYRQNSFVLKIRSLAVNILSILLQRDINFYINSFQGQLYIDRNQLLRLIKQNKHNFAKFLNCDKIKEKIMVFSIKYDIDLYKFFEATIFQQETLFYQFNNWSKILIYFKMQDLSKFADQINCIHSQQGKQHHYQPIFDVIKEKWEKESRIFKKIFNNLGIMKDLTKQNLLLYLIQKYQLSNKAKFSFQQGNKVYFPSLLKVILQILNQSLQRQQQNGNLDKISYLFQAIQHISKQLHQITLNESYNQPNYYTITNGINLQQFINLK